VSDLGKCFKQGYGTANTHSQTLMG